jgi:large subunit ribosomal protein L9
VQLEAINLERKEEASRLARQINGRSVVIVRQAGEAGQLYGSVNARDIAAAFTADGVTIERRQVQLPAALKELGIHQVRIRLHPEVDATVSVNIARTPEEAEIQADPERAATFFDERAEQPALSEVPPEFLEDDAFTTE